MTSRARTQAAALPPDRSAVETERRNQASNALDTLTVDECVRLMADDHDQAVRAVREAGAALTRFIEPLVERVRRGGRLVYVGAGTSGRLGVLDASECPPTFQSSPGQIIGIIAGGDPALRISSEGREDDRNGAGPALADLRLTPDDTLLGIAAGGTTPYVLGSLVIAKRAGAATGLLTCARLNAPEDCDHLITLATGPEVVTGSTRLKAGTATKIALNTITTTLFVRLGKVYGNLMVDVRATNDKLYDRAMRILCELCPELDRPTAADRLEEAKGDLKTAVVMTRKGVGYGPARQALDEAGGDLRATLG